MQAPTLVSFITQHSALYLTKRQMYGSLSATFAPLLGHTNSAISANTANMWDYYSSSFRCWLPPLLMLMFIMFSCNLSYAYLSIYRHLVYRSLPVRIADIGPHCDTTIVASRSPSSNYGKNSIQVFFFYSLLSVFVLVHSFKALLVGNFLLE